MNSMEVAIDDTSLVDVTTDWPASFFLDARNRRGKKRPAETADNNEEKVAELHRRRTVTPFTQREFKSLCRPRSICSAVSEFDDRQKQAIEELGFGGLLKITIQVTPLDLYGWLLDSFNPVSGIVYSLGRPAFQVTEADVRDVLLLPNEGIDVWESSSGAACRSLRAAWASTYKIGRGRMSIHKIKIVMMSLDGRSDDFKRFFVLYVVSCFLSPTINRNVRAGILHLLLDVTNIPRMNWCGYVLQSLCSAIKTWRKEDQRHVGGCLMILQVCYLHRHSWWGKTLPRELPLIQHSDEEMVKQRIEEEFLSGGFGLGIFKLEGYPVSAQQIEVAGSGVRSIILEVDADLPMDSDIERVYPEEFDRSLAKTKRDFNLFYRRNFSTLMLAALRKRESCTQEARSFVCDIDKMVDGLRAVKEVVVERKDLDYVRYEHPVVSTKQPECGASFDEYGSNHCSGGNINSSEKSVHSPEIDQCFLIQNLSQLLQADNPDLSWVQPLMVEAEPAEYASGHHSEESEDIEVDSDDSEDANKFVDAESTLEHANNVLFNSAPSSPSIDTDLEANLSSILLSFGSALNPVERDTCGSIPSPQQVQIEEMLGELNALEHVQLSSKLFCHYPSMMKLKRYEAIISDFCISIQKEYSRSTPLFSDGRVCLADASDFGSLEAGEEISTVILNAFATIVNHKKPKPAKPRMVCLDVIPNYSPLVCDTVAITLWDETLKSSRQIIQSSEMVMVPVLMNGHYFCVVANTKRAKFQYLDNLTHRNNIEEWMGAVISLRKLISEYMLSKGHHKAGEVAHYEIETVQGSWRMETGNKDCGVYIMHHMRHFQGDEVVENDVLSSPAKRNEFRAMVCAKLITSRANKCRNKVVAAVLEHYKNEV